MLCRRQRGLTLLEMAVAIMVLGLISVLVWQFVQHAAQRQHQQAALLLLHEADAALVGFAATERRLPCPDLDGDGNEDCSALQHTGRLPWRTLGLAAPRMAQVRYGALDQGSSANLMVAASYFRPMRVQHMTAVSWPRSEIRNLDFCAALHTAATLPAHADALHVRHPDGHRPSVAYAMALPGPAGAFGGVHSSSENAFESPRRMPGPDYRDTVVAVSSSQLWRRLDCGERLAAAGHAHFNSAAMAALLHQSAKDYTYQLDIFRRTAEIAVLSGGAGVANAAAGVGNAATTGLIATADALVTQGATAGIIAAAAAAIAANTAATVVAGAAAGLAVAGAVIYNGLHDDSVALAQQMATLSAAADQAALAAVELGD